ncbi:hypothetical protein ATANTOWER_005699, partial [Ataeniobius toweri]|nr:hypothetical protein [Ataeniobius toweri]
MEKEKKTTLRPYSSVDTMNSFGSAECKGIQGSKQKMKFQGLDAQGRGAFPLPLGFTPPEDPESQKKTSCLDIIFNTGSNRFKSSAVTDVASSRLFCSSFFSMSEMESGLLSRSNKTEESFTLDVDPTPPAHSEVPVRRQSLKAEMPEDNMYQGFNVILTETDMFSLLDLSPTLISEDAEDAETVKQRNIHYAECCKNRMDDDNYLERSSQTFVGEPKNKHTQANRNSSINEGTTATVWDMYDSFCEPKETRETQKADQEDCFVSTKKEQDKTERTMSGDTAGSTVSSAEMETCGECLEVEPGRDKFLLSESFKNSLLVTERVILLNVFQPKLAAFRGLPVLKDPYSTVKPSFEIQSTEDKDSTLNPTMEYLWTFACPLTTGHNITSMTWNKKNSGVLAIGFGDWASGSPKPGLICCWSLKNLTWPERVFPCHSSVTCLDFSANNPSQLAVGMYDGSVAIYNVQVGNHMACIANSRDCSKRHQQPVWQVIWTKQQLQLSGEEREEVLVSVSGDGRITKWLVLSNGFNCIDLMVVKRIQDHKKVPAGNQEKCDIVLLPRTPVHCVDFHPT